MSYAWQMLYIPAVLVLLAFVGVMMFRAVRGPRTTDRIVAINMISTMVVCIILIFSQLLREDWLLDVALIYAMISLVTVTMLASLFVKNNRGSTRTDGRSPEGQGPADGHVPEKPLPAAGDIPEQPGQAGCETTEGGPAK